MTWKNMMAAVAVGGVALASVAGTAFAQDFRTKGDTTGVSADKTDTICYRDCGTKDEPIDDWAIEDPDPEDTFFCCNPDLCWVSESQLTCELELVGECKDGQHVECYGQTKGGGGECTCTYG